MRHDFVFNAFEVLEKKRVVAGRRVLGKLSRRDHDGGADAASMSLPVISVWLTTGSM